MYNYDAYFLSTSMVTVIVIPFKYVTLTGFLFSINGWFFVCAKDSSSRFVTYFGYFFALQFIRNKLVQNLHVKTKPAELLTYIYYIS